MNAGTSGTSAGIGPIVGGRERKQKRLQELEEVVSLIKIQLTENIKRRKSDMIAKKYMLPTKAEHICILDSDRKPEFLHRCRYITDDEKEHHFFHFKDAHDNCLKSKKGNANKLLCDIKPLPRETQVPGREKWKAFTPLEYEVKLTELIALRKELRGGTQPHQQNQLHAQTQFYQHNQGIQNNQMLPNNQGNAAGYYDNYYGSGQWNAGSSGSSSGLEPINLEQQQEKLTKRQQEEGRLRELKREIIAIKSAISDRKHAETVERNAFNYLKETAAHTSLIRARKATPQDFSGDAGGTLSSASE
ncbi:uncharacterized protein LOC117181050 [Belonocnema kinseyi]|uniref:uncharacterized protein LOC117181050 n=1 Tax=Belonocnema kinseyi TaxID=2817044 RepID=UPI00143D49FA|nr:uncharacterized protein LOC117181050 [Belonocnema kinseyi]